MCVRACVCVHIKQKPESAVAESVLYHSLLLLLHSGFHSEENKLSIIKIIILFYKAIRYNKFEGTHKSCKLNPALNLNQIVRL